MDPSDDVRAAIYAHLGAPIASLQSPSNASAEALLREALERAVKFIGQTHEYKIGHTGATDILKAGYAALSAGGECQ